MRKGELRERCPESWIFKNERTSGSKGCFSPVHKVTFFAFSLRIKSKYLAIKRRVAETRIIRAVGVRDRLFKIHCLEEKK